MIDLTPVDVRQKSDEFERGFRGFDPRQVTSFLGRVADRLEEVRDQNRELEHRIEHLRDKLEDFEEREEALNEALLAAQELREESRAQAEREASLTVREAEARAEAIEKEAERGLDSARDKLDELRSRRAHFLRSFRALLEGYLAEVEVEQERLREADEGLPPAEDVGGEPDPEPPAVEPGAYGADAGADGGVEPAETDRGGEPTGSEDRPEGAEHEGEERDEGER